MSGTVAAQCEGDREGATIDVLDGDEVVATTTTAADGTWGIGSLLARAGWLLRLTPPPGSAVDGDESTTLDLSGGDVTGLDTALTALRPVSGTVTDEGPSFNPLGSAARGGFAAGMSLNPMAGRLVAKMLAELKTQVRAEAAAAAPVAP